MKNSLNRKELTYEERLQWRNELAAEVSLATAEEQNNRIRLFLFRCGCEWFAVDPRIVVFTGQMPSVHSIPHRPDSVEGVVSLRGAVTLCFSLHKILKCKSYSSSKNTLLLALNYNSWQVACRVDEAFGIVSVDPSTETAPPSTLSAAASGHITTLFLVNGHSAARLDSETLFRTFEEEAR